MFYKPPPVHLGQPPWSDADLARALSVNVGAVQEALLQHPGREVAERLDSLGAALRLFNKAGEAILRQIEHFHREAHTGDLLHRRRKQDLRLIEDELQEQLYVFAACSMTLVDQARALTKKVEVPGYDERVASGFAQSPRHRFVQEMRVDMIHLTLHQPGWLLIPGSEQERSTQLLIHADQLGRAGEYHEAAKQFLAANPKGVDLGRLVSDYLKEVNELHSWLRAAVDSVRGEMLRDLRRCQRLVRAAGSRAWWRLLLSQVVIQGKKDPYTYLTQYLADDELQDVLAMPHRSQQQVDRIIQLVDEDGACDEELRVLVYEAFGVGMPLDGSLTG